MATTLQAAAPTTRALSPLALWHLLSLDAPSVAALWVWFIARAAEVRLPLAAPAAMALAVWILYAADRLLDSRILDAPDEEAEEELEQRHLFHYRHRRRFLAGIAVAAIGLAALLHTLDADALRLYLVEAALLFAWFVMLHATHSVHRLPKEIAVGIFFSAAVFIPAVARVPGLRGALGPAAILFAMVCSLNCLFIYLWEHELLGHEGPEAQGRMRGARTPHLTTRLAIAHLPALAVAILLSGMLLAIAEAASARPIAVACVLSTAMLLLLHQNRRALSPTGLRAAADAALLTPLLLWWLVR